MLGGAPSAPSAAAAPLVLAFHKPRGLTVEQGSGAAGRGTDVGGGRVVHLNDYLDTFTAQHHPAGKLSAVGRLDRETTGLLLLTDDGGLSERILRPGCCAKIYEATVRTRAPLTHDVHLRAILDGLTLGDGFAKADAAVISRAWEERRTVRHPAAGARSAKRREAKRKRAAAAATTEADEDDGGAADTADATSATTLAADTEVVDYCSVLRVTMSIGRNRIVRRLLAAAGCPVHALKRVAIGPLVLDATAGGGGAGGGGDGEAAVGAGPAAGPPAIALGLSEAGACRRLTPAEVEVLTASLRG